MSKKVNPKIEIVRLNSPLSFSSDLYFGLMNLSWFKLVTLGFTIYIFINIFFGTLYFLMREGLQPDNLSWSECFFFSVQTFSTVGYGIISPKINSTHTITMIEIFVGLLSMALTTGLIFSKFSKPSGKFIFTDKYLLTQHEGKEAFVFRIANARSNQVMDASISLHILYDETTAEGIKFRRFAPLKLSREHTPIFSLSLTVAHFIDESSKKFIDKINNGENIEFIITVNGIDETFGQTIHDTKIYKPSMIHRGGHFHDILSTNENGYRVIDFSKFHSIKS